MNVLGICDSQDSGAALYVDGRLVVAINEERRNRVKLWGGFPRGSIEEVLRLGGLRPGDVDTVVLGTRITPNVLARAGRGWHQALRRSNGQFGYVLNLFIAYQALARAVPPIEAAEAGVARALLAREVRALGVTNAKVVSVEHHRAHAASAWATCPFESALVVTLDGLGDGLGVTVSVGERRRSLQRGQGGSAPIVGGLRRVHTETGFSAITLYYSRLTEHLGFTPIRDEGKVNGLAAYSESTPAIDLARALLHVKEGRFNTQNHLRPASPRDWPFSELGRFTREEVAASFQRNLEDQVRAWLRHWLAHTGMRHVAVAGGAFANVKLNQRIAEMTEVDGLWVFPHMGDGGLALGGCAAYLEADPDPLPDAYLGGQPDEAQMAKALSASGLPFQRSTDVALDVARALAAGRIVARYEGRMEYGPRALGNRSILAPAVSAGVVDTLNHHLQRSPFMPFAPAVHEAEFDACFTGGAKAAHASRFMTVSFDATPRMRELCPAAVHVDGTCRPQRVMAASSPGFARVLAEYQRLTGVPGVINTSFNMHEEPIVDGPEDAVASFLRSGLPYLAMGDYLAHNPAVARADDLPVSGVDVKAPRRLR